MLKATLLLLSIILLSTACVTKKPFVEQKNFKESTLLYVYVPHTISSDDEVDRDCDYTLRIDNELIDGYIRDGEYMVFHLKPSTITLSAIKHAILEHKTTLTLQANKSYFVKILKIENDDFQIFSISRKNALKEIKKTKLAYSVENSKKEKNSKIIKNEQSDNSKLEKVERANKLKKEGIITEEEFRILKKEILSK